MGEIRFPHLGIVIDSLGQGITIGNFTIAYYGMVIAFGMVMGYLMASWQAGRTGQNRDIYLDLAMWDIIFAVIGARAYYVIFSWDYYRAHPAEIFNIRGGGLAIYGGVIGGVLTTWIFSRVRHKSFLELVDTACAGLLTGQIIGRWGNFFNREAFGDYTDGLFAMQIPQKDVAVGNVTTKMLQHLQRIDGVEYIQVHPTFLYESLWNLCVLLFLLWFTPKRKFRGQLFLIYMIGYGAGRFWIESMRTDQLQFLGTGIAVSQVLSGALVVAGVVLMVVGSVRSGRDSQNEPS